MAVNVSNIEIAWYDATLMGTLQLSRGTSTDSFSYGDLVDDDSGAGAIDVVADADKSDFIGVSLSTIDGAVDAVSKVEITIKAIIRVPLNTGESTIYFGEAAAWATGANGTSWSFENTATEAIVHCFSESIVADATGLFMVDPYTIRAVTALGYFEIVT